VLVENGISDRKLGMHLVDNPTAMKSHLLNEDPRFSTSC
jgi:hypothetical protein